MHKTEIGTDIGKASILLNDGELVSIPTETVYGLAANGFSESAVLKIYAVKNRPQFNPLILHVANVNQIRNLVIDIPPIIEKLIKTFSPGPITYLLPKNSTVPELVTAGSINVAIRIPDHPLTLKLLSGLNFPLAAPSANPSGYVSPVTAIHVQKSLNGLIPYILDGGECSVGLESTIVGINEGVLQIHRLGAITIEQIQKVSGEKVEMALSHASPSAPGQLKSHYATSKPFYLGNINELSVRFSDQKIGIISFQKSYTELNPAEEIVLSYSGNFDAAASMLFKALRKMDESMIDIIIAERVPAIGIGLAINDRLERAAYKGSEAL
jgi:L-threonylcarbamoyladenylate synthase